MIKKIKIKVLSIPQWRKYTRGWPYCLRYLSLLHNDYGIQFIEYADGLHKTDQKINYPWIGVFHNTPTHPKVIKQLHPNNLSLSEIFSHPNWEINSLYCKGVFTFSKYTKDFIQKNTKLKVANLTHPTKNPKSFFDFNQFISNPNKKLILVGSWLRDYQQFFDLRTNLPKYILHNNGWPFIYHLPKTVKTNTTVGLLPHLSNQDYDTMLTKNIVFLPLYDSSANNTIVECIVKNTPILISKLPATIEYLGDDYPLFYNDLYEAHEKIDNLELIHETQIYLERKNKINFTIRQFISSFVESDIYKNIPIIKHI